MSPSQTKLHIGCGERYLDGYIHIDHRIFPHVDYVQGVTDLSNFESDTVDLIYASHVLEYFDREEVVDVLAEWRRVLRPGAVLRLAVPDFENLVEVYRETEDVDYMLGPLYGKIPGPGGPFYHKTVYDFASLSKLLDENGFTNIKRFDWREIFPKDYDDHAQAYFPHMDKEWGRLVSLNVEANKTFDRSS